MAEVRVILVAEVHSVHLDYIYVVKVCADSEQMIVRLTLAGVPRYFGRLESNDQTGVV